jgi:hypothetical protein
MPQTNPYALAPAGIPVGFALWLLGTHIERYTPTVVGLAMVAFSLYFVLYPPRPEDPDG